MKEIKAKKDFFLNNKFYYRDKPVDIKDEKTLRKLNEKGYIYPIEFREINEMFENKNIKKEEEMSNE